MHVRRTTLALLLALALGAILAGVIGTSALAAPTSVPPATSLQLLPPTGELPVGTTALHLVDRSRLDSFAPGAPRELMVQLWYPAATRATTPVSYMSSGTASTIEAALGLPPGTFGALPTHASPLVPVARGRHPLLLFSHGLRTMREVHTALLEDLASHGYVVAAIDHTYDAAVVEFPDGRVISGAAPALPSPPERESLLATRVADVRFVLDELTRLARQRTSLLADRLDLRRVGVFGHSFGGATAAATMLADRRLRAAVDLDGEIWSPVLRKGLDRPFMIMIGDDLGGQLTTNQARFFARVHASRWALRLSDAGHFAFTDLMLFADALPGLSDALDIGSIDPPEAAQAVRAYVRAFFETTLLARSDPLLDGPSSTFPHVQFLADPVR
jgi:predicted dienelactone hydrolase